MADWGIALVNAGGDEEGGQPILIYADIREMPHLCWSQISMPESDICSSQIHCINQLAMGLTARSKFTLQNSPKLWLDPENKRRSMYNTTFESAGQPRTCQSPERCLGLGLPPRCHPPPPPFPISFALSVLLSLPCLPRSLALSSSVLRMLHAWLSVWLEDCVRFQYVLPFRFEADKGG